MALLSWRTTRYLSRSTVSEMVMQGVVKLPQALIRDKRVETLFLLPASQTRDKDALTEDGVGRVITELRGAFDWVICDSPADIERGATLAMRFADAAVIVANSEVSSVRDSDRIMAGAPLMVVARNLGHADTRMVERHYGHLAPSYIADAIRAAAPKFDITLDQKVVPIDTRG
jgi:MinD-like ATPase involved in chromosome partitioning or flagellar assembly